MPWLLLICFHAGIQAFGIILIIALGAVSAFDFGGRYLVLQFQFPLQSLEEPDDSVLSVRNFSVTLPGRFGHWGT